MTKSNQPKLVLVNDPITFLRKTDIEILARECSRFTLIYFIKYFALNYKYELTVKKVIYELETDKKLTDLKKKIVEVF